jgi:hypothetical protein
MKLRRFEILCVALLALTGLFHLCAAAPLARFAAAHWGAKILAATDGNVPDAKVFLQLLLHDAVILFSLAASLTLVHAFGARWLPLPSVTRRRRWVVHSLLAFAAVNLWLLVASHTTLFWLLLWQGRDYNTAVTRFQLKHQLLLHHPAARKAVILGNSQARAQIEEAQLNQLFGAQLYTGELHFPGSRGVDVWLTHRHLEANSAQIVICYVPEGFFYGNHNLSEAATSFFSFSDWHAAKKLGALEEIPARKLGYGLLGDALPVFALREPLAHRLLGYGVGDIRQRQHDELGKPALDHSLATAAAEYQFDRLSEFQKRAFTAFVADCVAQKQTLMLIAGQINPKLGSLINPAVHEDMLAFLRQLRQDFPSVMLVDDCPAQSEADYEDITHVNKVRQEKFTEFISERLRQILSETNRAK